jgi:hypothetical protein
MSRTAPLTSKRCILYIYSTNVGTEYFKHALYSPFSPSKYSFFHNANFFGSCIIHILYPACAEIKKKNNSGAKGLKTFGNSTVSSNSAFHGVLCISEQKKIFISADGLLIFLMRRSVFTARYELKLHE